MKYTLEELKRMADAMTKRHEREAVRELVAEVEKLTSLCDRALTAIVSGHECGVVEDLEDALSTKGRKDGKS